jgi:hypothetical protein
MDNDVYRYYAVVIAGFVTVLLSSGRNQIYG